MTTLELATLFHTTYERLAPRYGYQTRPETRTFDPNSPNGRLMLHVAATILQRLGLPNFDEEEKGRCQWCGQWCGSKTVFALIPTERFDPVIQLGTVQLCLDCGRVQGQWPYLEEST